MGGCVMPTYVQAILFVYGALILLALFSRRGRPIALLILGAGFFAAGAIVIYAMMGGF
jgi:hypothetical protein